jgi:hypothetical protein
VTFVSLGQPYQSSGARCLDGQVWERRPEEPEEAFQRSVMETLQRYEHPTVVIFHPESKPEELAAK